MPLTDVLVRSAKSTTGKTHKLSDGGGLQLWLMPQGSKLWKLAYRFDRKQRKLSFGSYPAVGLKDARMLRDEAKHLLASGVDPGLQKKLEAIGKANSASNTFSLIADELLEKKRREGRSVSTLEKVEWLLRFARPLIGSRPIAEISAPEILVVLRAVESRGLHESAQRLRSTIGECFRYAVATGRATTDPTWALRGALTVPKVTPRAAIVDPKGYGALLRAVGGYDGTSGVRTALQLLALTFVRPGELRSATWSEFDLESAIWTIPAKRMKMRRPHMVPLAPQSVRLLVDLKKQKGSSELVFPSVRTLLRPLSENTLNAALRRLGYRPDEMTAHGFRSAASTIMNQTGKWNADAIEAQLAHIDGNKIRRAYHRAEYWDERVAMMTWWADFLDALRHDGG